MSDRKTISETLHDGISMVFDVDEVLYEEGTGHHQLSLIRNPVFGKVLVLDGAVQVTSRDEFIYHEMMGSNLAFWAALAAEKYWEMMKKTC